MVQEITYPKRWEILRLCMDTSLENIKFGNHPETDTISERDVKGIKMYQTMTGYLQWAVFL
jgi:hypothetical protein